MSSTVTAPRPLTGRTVLFCLLGFFGIILAMNVVLIRVAMSSFGGVETESAYKAGLAFNNDISAAQAQDARHWTVEANLHRGANGIRMTVFSLDGEGRPLQGLTAEARLSHPTDKRHDMMVDLSEVSPGSYQGLAAAPHGQWDLVISLKRNGEQVFRSKSRVIL